MNSATAPRPTPAVAATDRRSLPAWIYRDPEFFAAERDSVFRNSWQLVCHLSDIPAAGDFHTFEFFGESVVVLRAEDAERIGINMNRLIYSARVKTANGTADVAPIIIESMLVGNITLRNVPFGGKLYRIEAKDGKVTAQPETSQ